MITEDADGREHGTYAGYQQHHKAGEEACDACREGLNTYMTEYRKPGSKGHLKARTYSRAKGRALTRLMNLHPEDFQRLMAEERAKEEGLQ